MLVTRDTPTDPTGRSFLSYRRSRAAEAARLIQAQHDVGIPTWQDIEDLEEGPTESQIREVLGNPNIANAVLWITPEVADSAMIQRVEAPIIMQRHQLRDAFFVMAVAGGGLGYDAAAAVLAGSLRGEDLRDWNLRKVSEDPIDQAAAASLVRHVLRRRIKTIHTSLPEGEPLRVTLNTRDRGAPAPGVALAIDWSQRCNGRPDNPEVWADHLIPALRTVGQVVCEEISGRRPVEVSGKCSISAAVAFGTVFLRERCQPVCWTQPGAGAWSIRSLPKPVNIEVEVRAANVGAQDLAVLVSIATDVRPAFNAGRQTLPEFRAIISVHPSDGAERLALASAGEAVAIALRVQEEIRAVRREYPEIGTVHLFLAVPVGLGLLIGQLLNTLGDVQTYEHLAVGGIGRYVPAALLRPSD